MKKLLIILSALFIGISFYSCQNDADVVSYNLSKDADNFKIYRRIVFYNGITGDYILTIEGFCSIKDEGNQLEVVVKTEDGKYLKHFLGLSDNVTYFAEQIDTTQVSNKRYKVIFKPSTLIPTIEKR